MAKKWRSAGLLSLLLAGHELTPQEVSEIIAEGIREDLYLDVKSGDLLVKDDAGKRLRKFVSSFANADGGVLIVGIRSEKDGLGDKPVAVDGCPAEREPLFEWTTTALAEVAPYMHPPARHHVVKHPAGNVLVVAVARAPQLVPCREGSKLVHYLRHGDSTIKVDDYLHADLVLGRRSHPVLGLEGSHASFDFESGVGKLTFSLTIHNDGLAWINDGIYGFVGHSIGAGYQAVPKAMRQYLDVIHPDVGLDPLSLVMAMHPLQPLTPFNKKGPFGLRAVLPGNYTPRVRWRSVMFALPHSSVPVFVQMDYVLAAHHESASLSVLDRSFKQLPQGKAGEVGVSRA